MPNNVESTPAETDHGIIADADSNFGTTASAAVMIPLAEAADQYLPPQPFRIKFTTYSNNQDSTFRPGDTVKGNILFMWVHRCPGPIQRIVARIRCVGEIHYGLRWTDTVFQRTYYSKQYNIFGDDGGSGPREASTSPPAVPSGSLPFIFTLPSSGLPQSYTGSNGSIKYFIDAIAKCKYSIPYQTLITSEQFTMNDFLNLNSSVPREIVQGPINVQFDNSFHLLSTGLSLLQLRSSSGNEPGGGGGGGRCTGDIQVELSLDKRGFVAGEFIQFKITVVNHTRKVLPTNSLEFQQVIRYHGQNLTKDEIHVLAKSDGPCVEARSRNSSWQGSIEVPDGVPVSSPSNLSSCIKISYKLKIEIETGPLSRNVRYDFQILIGSVPFENIARRSRSIDFLMPHNMSFEEAENALNNNEGRTGTRTTTNNGGGGRHEPSSSISSSSTSRPPLGIYRQLVRNQSSSISMDCPSYLDLAENSDWLIAPPPSYDEAMRDYDPETDISELLLSTSTYCK